MNDLKSTNQSQPSVRLQINKRLYIILLCFFISTIFWLLIALSHDYQTTLTVPVRYSNLPGKKVVMNDLPTEITVRLKTSGFKIISFGFQKNPNPVEVDVSTSLNHAYLNSEILSLPTSSFMPDFSREFGKEVSITGFQPDSVVFNFSDITTKRVPVVLSYKVSFEKQYDTTGSPQLNPAEVDVSGPPSIINDLKSVSTEDIVLEKLKGTTKGKVKLENNRLLTYGADEIQYSIPVEKFTEGSVEIDVHTVNVNDGYSLKTFPEKIKVRYLVALSKYNHVDKSMFDAVVDAADLEGSRPSTLKVKMVTLPSIVKVTLLQPEKVDYILRKQ